MKSCFVRLKLYLRSHSYDADLIFDRNEYADRLDVSRCMEILFQNKICERTYSTARGSRRNFIIFS